MATLFEKQAGIVRTAAMGDAQARALSSSVRRLIVKVLYKKTMTISEIAAAAAPENAKARTSIRHHVEILRRAGVIEVVKIVPVRGTIEKHYTATTRVLEYSAPEDFDKVYSRDIRLAARRLETVVGQLARKAARRAPEDGADPEYEQFLLAEIINRAMTRVLEARGDGEPPAAAKEPKPARRVAHAKAGAPL